MGIYPLGHGAPINIGVTQRAYLPGFFIGISRLKMNNILHGVLPGFLIWPITSIPFLDGNIMGLMFFTVVGMIYGPLLELCANKVFKTGIHVSG